MWSLDDVLLARIQLSVGVLGRSIERCTFAHTRNLAALANTFLDPLDLVFHDKAHLSRWDSLALDLLGLVLVDAEEIGGHRHRPLESIEVRHGVVLSVQTQCVH